MDFGISVSRDITCSWFELFLCLELLSTSWGLDSRFHVHYIPCQVVVGAIPWWVQSRGVCNPMVGAIPWWVQSRGGCNPVVGAVPWWVQSRGGQFSWVQFSWVQSREGAVLAGAIPLGAIPLWGNYVGAVPWVQSHEGAIPCLPYIVHCSIYYRK